MNIDILQAVQAGQVFLNSHDESVAGLPWHAHPKFSGVSLKHLITAKDTDGKFSSHLVRVNQGCEIGNHIHAGTWELHEIIQGSGHCRIGQKGINYRQGVSAIIPADVPHVVQATETDLYIMAKFIPALL